MSWTDGMNEHDQLRECVVQNNLLRAEIDRLKAELDALVTAVDLVMEYNTPNRVAHLMLLIERQRPEHLGWGSWLAAQGYQNYPDSP